VGVIDRFAPPITLKAGAHDLEALIRYVLDRTHANHDPGDEDRS
jgi:hypothetical protein